MLTAFARNPGRGPQGVPPASYDEVIAANIPYQSTHLRLSPKTFYHDGIEPRQAPDQGRVFDIPQPYAYGSVLQYID